jgi:hypothetical protein
MKYVSVKIQKANSQQVLAKFQKAVQKYIKKHLYVCNVSVEYGTCPDMFKIAKLKCLDNKGGYT